MLFCILLLLLVPGSAFFQLFNNKPLTKPVSSENSVTAIQTVPVIGKRSPSKNLSIERVVSSTDGIPTYGTIPYIGKTVFNETLTSSTNPTFRPMTDRQLTVTRLNLFRQYPWKKIKGKGALKIKLEGAIDIEPSRPPSPFGGASDKEVVSSLPDLFDLLQYAAFDPRVQSIIVQIDRLAVGYATLQEIKRMMLFFKQSGKPLIGYCSSGSEKELFLGLVCDELYIPPDGNLDLRGFSTAATFLRGIFDKVGIEPQVQRIGKYKSFGDTFNRTTISEAQREVLSSLLTESSEFWAHTVARELNKSIDEVKSLWSEVGYKTVEDYKSLGYITGVKYLDQVETLLALRNSVNTTETPLHVKLASIFSSDAKKQYQEQLAAEIASAEADQDDFQLSREFEKYPRRKLVDINSTAANVSDSNNKTLMSVRSIVASRKALKALPAQIYLRKMQKGSKILRGLLVKNNFIYGPRIAVINAAGGINTGKSSKSGVNGKTLGSDTLISMVRQAKLDPNVKAVVIRVDSPGGSALASDLMWREIRLLSREKPVIASMVNVAASGGYYISMACDYILAEELTITGSIGVVTSKFNTQELNSRIGYGVETVSRGRYAEVLNSARGFTSEEEQYFADGAISAYTSFTTKAAQSRSMSLEQMQKVAQGRVWTGRQALDVGLVDEIGGLWSAVNVAAKMAKLPEIGGRDDVRIEIVREPSQGLSLPFPLSALSSLFSPMKSTQSGSPQAVLDSAFSPLIASEAPSIAGYLKALGIPDIDALRTLIELII